MHCLLEEMLFLLIFHACIKILITCLHDEGKNDSCENEEESCDVYSGSCRKGDKDAAGDNE